MPEASGAAAQPHPLPRVAFGAAAAVLFAVFLVLAVVVHEAGPVGIDSAVIRWVHSGPVSTVFGLVPRHWTAWVAAQVAPLGAALPALLLTAGLGVVAYRRRDQVATAICVGAPLLAVIAVELMGKPLVGRRRSGYLMFPSGHASVSAFLAVLLLILVYRWYGRRAFVRWVPVALVLPAAVSLAILRLSWHYSTDVFGGLALGTAVVLGVAAAVPERVRQRSGSVDSTS